MTVARVLADHLTGTRLDRLPEDKIHMLKLLVLDFLGVAAGGSGTAPGRIMHQYVRAEGGVAEATVIGAGSRTSASLAALANAVCGHSLELDDVDPRALFHYGPPVVAAAWAACEAAGGSGADLLAAVAAGCEMMLRLSDACNPTLRNRGFHTTAACGGFGAAVAAARALRLDPQRMTNAMGLAGAQAAGLMEMYGPSMQKRFNAGPPARSGVTAARLAQLGFTGADTIFEGERGFGRAFCGDAFQPSRLVQDLDGPYPVEIEFKPYACARPIHTPIDCCLDLRPQLLAELNAIADITVRRHPAWAGYHLNKSPRTYHEAQVSLPFSVAVALVTGQAGFAQYQEPYLFDPAVVQLAARVQVLPDPGLPGDLSVAVTVRMAGGRAVSSRRDFPLGSLQNPLTRDQLVEKFTWLATPVLSASAVAAIPGYVDRLPELPNLQELAALLAPGTTGGSHAG